MDLNLCDFDDKDFIYETSILRYYRILSDKMNIYYDFISCKVDIVD